MYWNGFEGGHGSAAVTAPSTTWLFAEGVCGGDANFSFQTYLLLANPGHRRRRPRPSRSSATSAGR